MMTSAKPIPLAERPCKQPFGQPLQTIDNIEWLRGAVEELWQMLDDIDTYSDMAKSDNQVYRTLVERKQKTRFQVLESDGYDLFLPKV